MIYPIDLTPEEAHKIYDVLVEECGALEDERNSFVFHQTQNHVREWRFQGKLGFGGKFWRNGGWWYVNYYAEDDTPERAEIAQKANQRLATIRKQFVNTAI